jgi:hypothetical protein
MFFLAFGNTDIANKNVHLNNNTFLKNFHLNTNTFFYKLDTDLSNIVFCFNAPVLQIILHDSTKKYWKYEEKKQCILFVLDGR